LRVALDDLSASARQAIEDKTPVLIDYDAVAAEARGVARSLPSHLALDVPLFLRGRFIGLLAIDDADERGEFSDREIQVAQGIAAQAAVAIENARLFESVHRQAERAEVLKELAEIGVTGLGVNDVAQRQAQAIVRLLGASNAAVVMSDGERLQPVALVGYPDEYVQKLTPLPEDALAAQAFRSGQARFVVDVHDSDASEFTRTVSSELGFGSFASLPLGPAEAPIGAVGFVWRETRRFDRDEVAFLEAVASELAVGLSNQRAQETLRESEERFHSLAESIPNLAWWANADGYITWYNRRWYEYTGTVPEQMEGWGWQSVHDPEVLPAVLETWTASIATGEPFDMEFPLRGADGMYRTFLTRAEPLKDSSGRVIRWFGTNTDISAIKATEVRLRTLIDSEKESARLSEALNAANAAVHSSLDIDQVMQSALETGVKALGSDAAAVEMLDGDDWVVRYQSGFALSAIGTRFSKEQAPNATSALLQAAPLAIADLQADEKRNIGFVEQYDLKSVLAVPLNAKSQTIGCALFYTAESIKHFTEAEVDFGRKLGSSVSLALENARLYGAERDTANVLQSALLTLPASLSGFEFANAYSSATAATNVGGDFYDIFELDEHYVGITIGDISGKGLDAAVLTSLIRNSIRAYASEDAKRPSRVLAQANQLIFRSTPTEVFATVFFAMVDRRDGRLVYANAGHPAAAVVKPDGTSARMPATGPLLGAFPDMLFEEREGCLDPDDLLFLYTDGLTEARRDGELYGEDRLFAMLPTTRSTVPRDVIDAVLVDVNRFAGDRLRDDLAILAVRRVVS
jgi:PAS domain S-box-containing protein